ncbi:cyclic nucleotide-binding domain-containing protein [Bdellovibrio sp. HCB337]|uniref:cyclic nucleotide-binding domain-containing protein n=1 Tax=Bdellovibrio sp. HCB337 TaxID=3394358 RepID=UPI0039A6BC0D
MRLHPADVAREIKNFAFFSSFSEDLLLQVSTMMVGKSFKKGEFILRQGQPNQSLYFIRSGKVEIILSGEVVATLDHIGEVLGEMSVISENPATTSVRAAEDVECFSVKAEDFAHVHPKDKDHFNALLYRLYSSILVERLIKTNEKARLFEIANRELQRVQADLQEVGDKQVLLVESDKKQQVIARMAVGGTGVRLDIANNKDEAESFIQAKKYDAILCEEAFLDILVQSFQNKISPHLVLLTNQNVTDNLQTVKGLPFVDNIMSRDPEDRSFTVRSLLTTMTKVLNQNIFGIEKYLSWGADVQLKSVKCSKERDSLKDEMVAHFKVSGIRASILDRVYLVAEEMLMNAIYDAPTDGKGQALFNHLPRKTEVNLQKSQESMLRYAFDGTMIALSVEDPFGALTKEIIIQYLESCYHGKAGSLNANKGGAGRGLHQIIENSDLTIFNVKKGVKTEVISLFNLESGRKEHRPSFHYFFV